MVYAITNAYTYFKPYFLSVSNVCYQQKRKYNNRHNHKIHPFDARHHLGKSIQWKEEVWYILLKIYSQKVTLRSGNLIKKQTRGLGALTVT